MKSCVKHANCDFCQRNFRACSIPRASAHILGQGLGPTVLGLKKVGLSFYIPIVKEDNDKSSAVIISELYINMLWIKIQIILKVVDLYSELH
jgi:hypothetical protein